MFFSSNAEKYTWRTLLLEIVMLVICCIVVLPFYYLFVSVFKTTREMGLNPLGLPGSLYLENFKDAWEQIRFWQAFGNTLLITFSTLIIVVLFGSMAAYAVARRQSKFYRLVMLYFLLGFMVPFQTTMIPLYQQMQFFGLINKIYGLIILSTGSCVFAFFLYQGFIKTVPYELEESAVIDGAKPFRVFFQITFPLLKPITVTMAIFHVMSNWNDFMTPFLFLHSRENTTLMLEMYRGVGEFTNNWPLMMSIMVLIISPLVLFYIFAQRFIIEGLTSGAVKG
ncbi:MAG: carbohydrate ABC transporter permease [Clostridiales bacterium]|nr:carbohydrate ABC transporter permease [Clostridiales bacterium]PWM42459.1 MAG: carbohydrate ABC transporter permease [Clostridiales bacterium]